MVFVECVKSLWFQFLVHSEGANNAFSPAAECERTQNVRCFVQKYAIWDTLICSNITMMLNYKSVNLILKRTAAEIRIHLKKKMSDLLLSEFTL